jgi:hypothetical protein
MNDDPDIEAFNSFIEITQDGERISWTLFRVLLWFWWPW